MNAANFVINTAFALNRWRNRHPYQYYPISPEGLLLQRYIK